MIEINSRKIKLRQTILNGWRPCFWIIILGVIVLSPTLLFDYHYLDDNELIMDNMYNLENPTYIFQTFKEGIFRNAQGSDLYYRPLLATSFVINAQFNNDTLFFFHLTNIILHLIATCLLFVLLTKLKLRKWLAWLLAIIYVIHPIHLQAIAWLPGRNDTLLAIFLLAGFIFFLNFVKTNKNKWYVLFLLFYILSLFTKETAIMLPILCLLYLWLIQKDKIFSLRSWLVAIPYLLITVPWLFLRSAVLAEQIGDNYNVIESLLANFPAIIPFIGKIVFPINLSVLPILADMPMIYGIVTIIGIVILLYFSPDKKWGHIIFGLAWLVLLLLPSFIRPLSSLADFAEHRMYIPIIGFIIVLSQIKISVNNKKTFSTIFTILVIVVSILFIVKNVTHAQVYKNKITFWSNAVQYSPNSSFNRNNLGAMYYLDGKYNLAEQEWLIAKKLNPNEPLTHNNLGLIYARRGQLELAEAEYKQELAINPNYDNAHFNLGLLYFSQGNQAEAIRLWQKTIELNPDYFDAYNNLAIYHYQQGDIEQAKYYLNQILERGGSLDPEYVNLLENQ